MRHISRWRAPPVGLCPTIALYALSDGKGEAAALRLGGWRRQYLLPRTRKNKG
jgi:hypothetical protein